MSTRTNRPHRWSGLAPLLLTAALTGSSLVPIPAVAANSAPVAVADAYFTPKNVQLTRSAPGLLANDLDADHDALAAELASGSTHGTATVQPDGSFAYIPRAGFRGTDAFTYRVFDGAEYSPPAAVTITVNAPPVAAPDSYTVLSGRSLYVFADAPNSLLSNDSDSDGDIFMLEDWSDAGTRGTLHVWNTGMFQYSPPAIFVGTDTFTYRVTDGIASSSTTVSISVVPYIFTRIEGATRIETAIQASRKAFAASTARSVVIATAYNWPDALGGSALAGALDAPILLTAPGALSAGVADEIERLGATKAIVLGGEAAVSNAVFQALGALEGLSVERIGGANRYVTANIVAARTVEELRKGPGYDGTAFVATGVNFPDALGAAPLAAANGWPIYLANPAWAGNPTVVSAMRSAGATEAIVLGRENVVTPYVALTLRGVLGHEPLRLAGTDRYATAIEVAKYGVAQSGLSWDKMALATGQDFPDALAGGVLQGKSRSVMLLTPSASLYPGVSTVVSANKVNISEVRFLGGLPALSQTVRDQVADALK